MTADATLVLSGGRVIDPAAGHDGIADVVLEKGVVARIGAGAADGISGERVTRIDCRGKIVAPGFVDMHVHFREPGQEYKEDIASGLRAAARGGYTAVCPMPNTRPVNDNRAITQAMVSRAREVGGTRLFPFGAITLGSKGEVLTEMADMRDAGAIGVSDDGVCVMSAAVMRRALQYAGTFDLLVSQHCEDHTLTSGAQMHEGAISTKLGLKGWPREAEDVIVARDLVLNERIGARYHVAHLSTKGAARLVREAKARGMKVSAEVTPHHLLLTDHELLGYRTACKVNPPLREAEDVEATVAALADGTIDCIATDHAPHSPLEKDCELAAASPGLIGLETMLPLLLGLVRDGKLSMMRLIESCSTSPARVARVTGGTLALGSPADVAVIDPDLEWVVDRASIASKSLNTPWLGKTMRGACALTIVGGKVAFQR